MAGSKSRPAPQSISRSKVNAAVKAKKGKSIQKTIDAFHTVSAGNADCGKSIDYKAPVNIEGTEWVNVDSDGESSKAGQSTGKSWAEVVSPCLNTLLVRGCPWYRLLSLLSGL